MSQLKKSTFAPKENSSLHSGRLTWNLQITHLERNMIFQTSMIMFHVNLPGCISDDSDDCILEEIYSRFPLVFFGYSSKMNPAKYQKKKAPFVKNAPNLQHTPPVSFNSSPPKKNTASKKERDHLPNIHFQRRTARF